MNNFNPNKDIIANQDHLFINISLADDIAYTTALENKDIESLAFIFRAHGHKATLGYLLDHIDLVG